MDKEKIAKEANTIAHQIVEATKMFKNEIRFGREVSAMSFATDIKQLSRRLKNMMDDIDWYD